MIGRRAAAAIAIALFACAGKREEEPPARAVVEPLAAFEQRYGGMWVDGANTVVETKDGGYAVAGYSNDIDERRRGELDGFVIRVDARGDPIWRARHVAEGGAGEAYGLHETPDGGFVVAGESKPIAWLIRLDAEGKLVWERKLGQPRSRAFAVRPAPDGGWFVVGSQLVGEGDVDAALWRVDARGEPRWEKRFGGPKIDLPRGLVVLADGTLAIAGWTRSTGAGNEDGWLLRVTPDGELIGAHTYGGADDDFFHAIALGPGGDLAMAGSTRSRGAGERDAWLVIAGPDGAVKREHVYGGPHDELIFGLAVAPDGRVLLVGSVKQALREGLAVFVGPDGAEQERRAFDDLRRELKGAVATRDGGWALAGDYASLNSNYGNLWLLKLDSSGKGP